MNEAEELYGFERLLERGKSEGRGATAEEFLQAIDREVKAFAGAARQHDDMTVIVVRAV